VRERKISAQNAPGRPMLTWDELAKRDRVLLGMGKAFGPARGLCLRG